MPKDKSKKMSAKKKKEEEKHPRVLSWAEKMSGPASKELAFHRLVNAIKRTPLVAVADEKGKMVVERPLAGARDMVSRALGGNPLRTRIVTVSSALTSGSGSAYTTVVQANMALAGEWSTFAAIFDEVKCHSVACRFWARVASNDALGIVTWDQDDTSPLSSVQSGLAASKHTEPQMVWSPTTTSALAGYVPQEMRVSSGKLSGEGFPDESSGTPVAYPVRGQWVATTASTAIVGFFKPYFEAVGSQTWALRYTLVYQVSFRLRS